MRRFLAAAAMVFAVGCSGGDDKGGASDPITHLTVAPDGATIDTATTIRMRATGVTESGRLVAVSDVSWTVSAGTVDADGNYTPAAAGSVDVAAEADGKEGAGTLTVVAPGTLDALVVDAASGTPVSGATIALVTSGSLTAITGGDGTTQLTGGFSGALDVVVTATNYHPVTIYGLKTKNVRIPMRPENPPANGFFSGTLDFTEAFDADTAPAGYLWVGIAGPAIKGNILAYGLDSLLGPNRPVEIFEGTEFDAPSNLYVHGFTEPFLAAAPPGQTVAFGLGGEVAISEILDIVEGGTDDLGQVVAELLPIFNSFYYATREGINVASNQTLSEQNLVLTQPLSKRATLSVPPRPVNDPNPLVIAAVDFGPDIGFVPAGLTIVDGATADETTVQVPPLTDSFEDRSYVFLVVSQEGGLGTDSADQQVAVLSRGVTRVSNVETPTFLSPPAYASFIGDGDTLTFDYAASTEADFVYHTFTRDLVVGTSVTATLQWDVVAAGDSDGFVLPMVANTNAAQAGGNWSVQTVGLESQTYESLFTPSAPIDATNYFNDANRVVITNADVN